MSLPEPARPTAPTGSRPYTRSPSAAGLPAGARRPPALLVAAILSLAALTSGCGKSNLVHAPHRSGPPADAAEARGAFPHHVQRGPTSSPSGSPGPGARRRGAPPALAPVRLPLPLSAARAARFAAAVNLTLADVIGASVTPRSPEDPEEERQASRCGNGDDVALGGGRSPKLDRGSGLEHETISSSVVLLSSVEQAQQDFAYADSPAGLACYGRVLRKSLQGGSASSDLHLGRVRLQRLQLAGPGTGQSSGIRISARVGVRSSELSIPIYIDAVGFLYGPAEIEIYATSFVQPEPSRTEQELLELLERRARHSPL